jgi:hypothetical protein
VGTIAFHHINRFIVDDDHIWDIHLLRGEHLRLKKEKLIRLCGVLRTKLAACIYASPSSPFAKNRRSSAYRMLVKRCYNPTLTPWHPRRCLHALLASSKQALLSTAPCLSPPFIQKFPLPSTQPDCESQSNVNSLRRQIQQRQTPVSHQGKSIGTGPVNMPKRTREI